MIVYRLVSRVRDRRPEGRWTMKKKVKETAVLNTMRPIRMDA